MFRCLRSLSLFSQIILFGVLLVTLGGVARYYVQSRILHDDIADLISAQQNELAESVARDVDSKIVSRKELLRELAYTLPLDLLGHPAALQAWLGMRHRVNPLFNEGILVTDAHGKILADYPVIAGRRGVPVGDQANFAQLLARADGSVVIGAPRVGLFGHRPLLPMGIVLRGNDGNVRATLIGVTALYAPDFLERILNDRIGDSGSYVLVSPRDKLFVAAGEPSMVLQATPPTGVNPLHDRAMAGYRGSGITHNAQGVEELASIVSVPSTGWFVVARMPSSEAFAPVTHIQKGIVRSGVLSVLAVILLIGFIVRVMLRPLYQAARLADQMTLGETPLAPLPVRRDDEVGHLTRAFNRLLEKLSHSQEELRHLAHHDALTGLPNRALLGDRLRQELARTQRYGTRLALCYLDLDGFKAINDELGHETGDLALIEVAARLRAVTRRTDTVARIGGDEFVLLLVDLPTDPRDLLVTYARKCIEAIDLPLDLRQTIRQVGVSIGIAVSEPGCTPECLLQAADQAMYTAKARGRGCFVFAEVECTEAPVVG